MKKKRPAKKDDYPVINVYVPKGYKARVEVSEYGNSYVSGEWQTESFVFAARHFSWFRVVVTIL